MAMQKKLIILAITAMFLEVSMAATTYTVGSPNGGWDTNTNLATWASTQSFFVGDSLVFQYTLNHNVLEVDKANYDLCQTSNPVSSDNSGATTIPLSSPGKRYFICGTSGHCGQGQKVEIDTLQVVTSTPPPASPTTPSPASPATPPPASSTTPPPASPETPPPASSTTPPPASPETPPPTSSTTPPPASPPVSPPVSSPPPSLTVPSTESPSSTHAPSALVPPPPPSSAHKCSFQATIAMGVGFVMVFLAL